MANKLNTRLLFERWAQLGVEDPNASRTRYLHINEDYDFYTDDESDMLVESDFVEAPDIVHIGEVSAPAVEISASRHDRNPSATTVAEPYQDSDIFIIPDFE